MAAQRLRGFGRLEGKERQEIRNEYYFVSSLLECPNFHHSHLFLDSIVREHVNYCNKVDLLVLCECETERDK